jgi:hypothetical protein
VVVVVVVVVKEKKEKKRRGGGGGGGGGRRGCKGATHESPSTAKSSSLHPFLSAEPMTKNADTDIWLVVSVPVLSEQMTDVHPSVSTDGRRRTSAFWWVVMATVMVVGVWVWWS